MSRVSVSQPREALAYERLGHRRDRHPADEPYLISLDDGQWHHRRWRHKPCFGHELDEPLDALTGSIVRAHDLTHSIHDSLLPPGAQSLEQSLLLLEAEM